MKKVIKLNQQQINRMVKKVIKEETQGPECSGIKSFENMGYKYNGVSLQKKIIPGRTFYIFPKLSTESKYCNFTLIWADGMPPINLGHPDYCYGIAKAYEEAFKMKRV